MSDFIPNKLGFDTAGCTNMINKIFDSCLDELSAKLVQIVMTEIWKNGNGSKVMRLDAAMQVKETKREITNEHILLEAGIDMDKLKGTKEDLFVRVSVVLHGNMNGDSWTWRDARVLYTKPGVETYGKNVTNKRVHVPDGYKRRALPISFSQQNVIGDIVEGVSSNIDNQIAKYVDSFVNSVNNALKNIDWSAFLIVG